MGILSDGEIKELRELACSLKLRQDLRKVEEQRHNPFLVNGVTDLDRLLTFLTEYNYFMNHAPKPFRKIIDKVVKL